MASSNNDFLFGVHVIEESLLAFKDIDKVLIQKGLISDSIRKIRQICGERDIPIQVVPVEKLDTICKNRNHQGIMAFQAYVTYTDLTQLVPYLFEKGETPILIMLDGVTDVRNVGAIARSTECFGAHGLILPYVGGAKINADAMKTSAGALNHLTVCREKSLKKSIDYLRDSGFQIIACSEKAKYPIHEIDLTGPLCVVMGDEGDGISKEVLKSISIHTNIPLTGKITSLNVSVATGVVLYEIARQRIIGQ